MAAQGFRVRVLTSAAGFADPAARYPRRETRDGVEIRRLPWGSLGKGSLGTRTVGGLLFLIQAFLRGLFGTRPSAILVSTSPPMAPVFGYLLSRCRRAPLTFWLMDLNPDQAIATGAVRPRAWSARLLERANRAAARHSHATVALDHFMAERVRERWGLDDDRLAILPPWPHEDHIVPVPHADNPFRERHGLQGKRVVLFSGNMSPVHPLDTILQAAAAPEIRNDPGLAFVFIGAGGQRAQIEETVRRERLGNVTLLPYQPLDQLKYSLSAADVHVVSMGEAMVGIVHPCKVYGAMAAARPVLFLGPLRSHIGELVERHDFGWQVEHGDVDGTVALLHRISGMAEAELAARGNRARVVITQQLSQQALLSRFCDLLEQGVVSAANGGREQGDPHWTPR
jgi:glycosyltransferase involved in cell wall biosynthesis